MDDFQSFLEATPEKGVIVVEFFWQPSPSLSTRLTKLGNHGGGKTSLVFFRRIRTTDVCWCGSKRKFGKCHRRGDDWTYVTIDPDNGSYSPVVLLEHKFPVSNPTQMVEVLASEPDLLSIEQTDNLSIWGVPMKPTVVNEVGQLLLGTIGINQDKLVLETNSDNRFKHLMHQVQNYGVSVCGGETIRAEPQMAFPGAVKAPRPRRTVK